MDFAPIRGAIAEAMETLREDHREALRFRVIEELSYPEVARRLSCSEDERATAGEPRAQAPRAGAPGTRVAARRGEGAMNTDIEYLQQLESDLEGRGRPRSGRVGSRALQGDDPAEHGQTG